LLSDGGKGKAPRASIAGIPATQKCIAIKKLACLQNQTPAHKHMLQLKQCPATVSIELTISQITLIEHCEMSLFLI